MKKKKTAAKSAKSVKSLPAKSLNARSASAVKGGTSAAKKTVKTISW